MWTEAIDNRLVFTNPPIKINLKKIMKQVQKIQQLLNSASKAVIARQRKKLDRRHLMELDDRLLDDIGVSRYDLRKGFH